MIENTILRQDPPRLKVITGCMFSGKTEELTRLLDRYYWGNVGVKLLRPDMDTRGNKTHAGKIVQGTFVPRDVNMEILRHIIGIKEFREIQVIGIDEGNFFENSLIDLTQRLIDEESKIVIVAGLDKNFANKGYEPMPQLIHNADEVIYLNAVCSVCGSNYASHTQRLTNGKPATLDSPQDIVGGKKGEKSSQKGVTYEARCRYCYVLPQETKRR
jgi:thymidine kinase